MLAVLAASHAWKLTYAVTQLCSTTALHSSRTVSEVLGARNSLVPVATALQPPRLEQHHVTAELSATKWYICLHSTQSFGVWSERRDWIA